MRARRVPFSVSSYLRILVCVQAVWRYIVDDIHMSLDGSQAVFSSIDTTIDSDRSSTTDHCHAI